MILIIGIIAFVFLFPVLSEFIGKLIAILFIIPFAFFSAGFMAFAIGSIFGFINPSFETFMTCCFVFGSLPALLAVKVLF
jgi:hypothetical protein